MLDRALAAVREFHETFGAHIENKPTLPSKQLSLSRLALLEEEVGELYIAEHEKDIIEIADALGDIIYITLGTAISYGIPLDKVFQEIHKNNMSKLWSDGKPRFDKAHHKVIKPPNFKHVDLKPILFPNEK